MLAKAGEGTIYRLADRADIAAKVFHRDLVGLHEKLAKVTAMAGTVPEGAVQTDGFVVLAWPQKVLHSGGAPVGFVMPRINTAQAVEIHSLSNPSNRANPLPTAPQWPAEATWAHLVTAAANLCLAVDVVHHVDAVIGDFQERNILVSNTVRVTLVDCDSMQFTGPDGRQYLSPLGRPEFTAPELAKVDLRHTARDKTSDLFALGLHIHLLIMAGNHPFLRGIWTGAGDQPDALTLAHQGNWAGGPGSLLLTHPLAPPANFLPNEIQELFTRAFTLGARDPGARPTADEWRQALSRIQIISCARQPRHQIPAGTDICPWCDIEAARNARKTAGRSARLEQTIMPALGQQLSPPMATAASAPASVSSGGSSNRLLLWGLLVLLVVVGVTAVLSNVLPGDNQTATPSHGVTTTSRHPPIPKGDWRTTPIVEFPSGLPAPRQLWKMTIAGTCDEGGSCGLNNATPPIRRQIDWSLPTCRTDTR
ncbi:hypothetical protein A5759_03845 [Mycobacterium sp. 852014-52144_SCH5372336]|nr:hypothetical protein A5759_03845 [Mycobacterium sp. 852014-52144_SCH5372336]